MLSILRYLCLAAALAVAMTPAVAQVGKTVEQPRQIAAGATYLTSQPLRERALGALLDAIDGRPVSKLEITDDSILLWAQDPIVVHYTEEWTASRMKFLFIDRDSISGPRATDGDSIVSRREGSFFDPDTIAPALARVDSMVAEGIAMAQMERRPDVGSITVARRISILPSPAYGDIEVKLYLRTERENATIYATANGDVYGGDLAGTPRVERLNLVSDDDWPMADAQRRIAEVLGTKRLYGLRIYDSYVFMEAEHPTRPQMTKDYSWNLGGISAGFEQNDVFAGIRDTALFSMAELDLSRLPDIKRVALEAFESPGSKITHIEADKPTDRPGQPVLLWSIDLQQADGEKGKVLLDAGANVIDVVLPETRLALTAEPWLAPVTVAETLKRLEKAFGPDAKYGEILFNDFQGTVLVEDPQAPGTMASFIIDRQSVTRFGTPMPWEAELDPNRIFTIAELGKLDEAAIRRLADRTLERMEMQDLAVFRYTFTRNALMMNPEDDRLLLEIRAGKDDGWTGGWVTFDLSGGEVDVMMP
ncbi:MAG: hypothetical protein ACO1OG_10485 [Devosia sp.]